MMAISYGRKRRRQNNIFYTVVTAILICAVFTTLVGHFYIVAKDEAYEQLHIQTKQIKDDLQLQLKSDVENLTTLASFAAKLYLDGGDYNLVFSSFKSIGLIKDVGILTENNEFITRAGTFDSNGDIFFEQEKGKVPYITSRVKDIRNPEYDLVRMSVPIVAKGQTVGILYGAIMIEDMSVRYGKMAEELDAQLFVFDIESGDLVIDPINDKPGNISALKNRKYNDGFTYEEIIENTNGYSSFVSKHTGKTLYLHYSTMDVAGWKIVLARSHDMVFEETNAAARVLTLSFITILAIMMIYMFVIFANEKNGKDIANCISNIRKMLLEINQDNEKISRALEEICLFTQSGTVIFFDTDGKEFEYVSASQKIAIKEKEREYFITEMFRKANEKQDTTEAIKRVHIKADKRLQKENAEFYSFLKKQGVRDVYFVIVTDENNRKSVICAVNAKPFKNTNTLLEGVAVCFSIALYNKTYLHETEEAVITDTLTGTLNRVAYNKDLVGMDYEDASEFSCVYIDVNELHVVNNKYGHTAGDEMLMYIANALKEVFYGHKVYRMGGDEFLVFVKNTGEEAVKNAINSLTEQLSFAGYHVAVGMSYRTRNSNTEEMVREAEIVMYEEKARYYQNKESGNSNDEDMSFVHITTGIDEIDAILSLLKEHYNGIYKVSLDTDKASHILMPAYLEYDENEEKFSVIIKRYIAETLNSEYHRAVTSFINYDALKRQLAEGKTPKITYKKTDDEVIVLSVHKLGDENDTLWIFSKN